MRVEGLPPNIFREFEPSPAAPFAALMERRPLPVGEAGIFMISLTHVSKIFEGKRKAAALEGIDLEVGKGEVVSSEQPPFCGHHRLALSWRTIKHGCRCRNRIDASRSVPG